MSSPASRRIFTGRYCSYTTNGERRRCHRFDTLFSPAVLAALLFSSVPLVEDSSTAVSEISRSSSSLGPCSCRSVGFFHHFCAPIPVNLSVGGRERTSTIVMCFGDEIIFERSDKARHRQQTRRKGGSDVMEVLALSQRKWSRFCLRHQPSALCAPFLPVFLTALSVSLRLTLDVGCGVLG